MDINKQLSYITCLYDDLFGTEFGGRPNPWRKYYYGLESLTKTMSPIVIYTWPQNIKKVEDYFIKFLGLERCTEQIKVLEFDLFSSFLYQILKEKKRPEHGIKSDRSYDLMLGKYIVIKDAIKRNIFNSEYFFWIDAGLSSSALFPNKHLNLNNKEKQYNDCVLFTPAISKKLIEKCNNHLILFKINSLGHWFHPDHINRIEKDEYWYIVGGLFGGNPDVFSQFCDDVLNSFLFHLKNYDILYLDEQIMTILYSYNREKYNIIEFDVWHHENSGNWVQEFIKNKKSFYKIFEEFNNGN